MIDVFFFVSEETERVVDICSTGLGMGTWFRRNAEWQLYDRHDLPIKSFSTPGRLIYQVDWDREPITDADPSDESAWDHQIIQMWDKGIAAPEEYLLKYAFLVDPA